MRDPFFTHLYLFRELLGEALEMAIFKSLLDASKAPERGFSG